MGKLDRPETQERQAPTRAKRVKGEKSKREKVRVRDRQTATGSTCAPLQFAHPPIRRKSWHELHDKFCQEAFEGIPSCLLRTTTDAVRVAANDYLSPDIRRP